MQQSPQVQPAHHTGWSESESNLLWETADEAQQQGLPLKQVFERIAQQTGRRPNSIRNYYYAQVRQRENGPRPAARFVPFTEPEVRQLLEDVLRGRAKGQSVRACLQALSGGDRSLMLRYQNKYRSVLKARPELIRELQEKLRAEGIECTDAQLHPRPRASLPAAAQQLTAAAQQSADPELIRACETLSRLILASAAPQPPAAPQAEQLNRLNVRLDLCRLSLSEQAETISQMQSAAYALECSVREFAARPPEERTSALSAFCDDLLSRLHSITGEQVGSAH